MLFFLQDPRNGVRYYCLGELKISRISFPFKGYVFFCKNQEMESATIEEVKIPGLLNIRINCNESMHNKQGKDLCAQHKLRSAWALPSLIRVFAVQLKKVWVLNYPKAHREDSDQTGICTGWSESLLGTNVSLLVLSCCGWRQLTGDSGNILHKFL